MKLECCLAFQRRRIHLNHCKVIPVPSVHRKTPSLPLLPLHILTFAAHTTAVHCIDCLDTPKSNETVCPEITLVPAQACIDEALQRFRTSPVLFEILKLKAEIGVLYVDGSHLVLVVATQPLQRPRGGIAIVPTEAQRALRAEHLNLHSLSDGRVRVGVSREEARARQAQRRPPLADDRGRVAHVRARRGAVRHGAERALGDEGPGPGHVVDPGEQVRRLSPGEAVAQHLPRVVRLVPPDVAGIVEDPGQGRREGGGDVAEGAQPARAQQGARRAGLGTVVGAVVDEEASHPSSDGRGVAAGLWRAALFQQRVQLSGLSNAGGHGFFHEHVHGTVFPVRCRPVPTLALGNQFLANVEVG